MYVTSIDITNLRLLRSLKLDFTRDGAPRGFTVIIGENGTCKTSILQAIALAASGATRANQLADAATFPDRRQEIVEGPRRRGPRVQVSAEFWMPSRPERVLPGLDQVAPVGSGVGVHSQLSIEPGESVFRGRSHWTQHDGAAIDPLETARAQNLNLWFVAGYGVDRRLPRPTANDKPEDPAVGRLQTLFDRGKILGTGFADVLPDPQAFAATIREVLVHSRLLPNATDVELRGRGGVRSAADLVEGQRFTWGSGRSAVKVPASWLSQGYQSMIAWIADIVGQVYWEAGGPVETDDIEGLVLVDEIDLHLHPKWQRDLARILKDVFPKLQIVATTHSPMVLPGLEADEVIRLALDAGGSGDVVLEASESDPRLLTASQLYESYFGIEALYPSDLGKQLRRYALLTGNAARTPAENEELERLKRILADAGVTPGWSPVR